MTVELEPFRTWMNDLFAKNRHSTEIINTQKGRESKTNKQTTQHTNTKLITRSGTHTLTHTRNWVHTQNKKQLWRLRTLFFLLNVFELQTKFSERRNYRTTYNNETWRDSGCRWWPQERVRYRCRWPRRRPLWDGWSSTWHDRS